MSIEIQTIVEQIETTSDGTLPPYKASVMREFIPGIHTNYLVINGQRVARLTDEQAADLVSHLRRDA